MLVIVSGLPASGKTTLSRPLARALGAAHVRVDTIEQAIVRSGLARHPVGPAGYAVGYAVAADLLAARLSVVAESVNPLPVTRAAWRAVAQAAGTDFVDIEVICSDPAEHRRRAESRAVDIPGLVPPTWQEIIDRDYHPWGEPRAVIDTAGRSAEECVDELLTVVASRPSGPDEPAR